MYKYILAVLMVLCSFNTYGDTGTVIRKERTYDYYEGRSFHAAKYYLIIRTDSGKLIKYETTRESYIKFNNQSKVRTK